MPSVATYSCSNCKKLRVNDTNHWWALFVTAAGGLVIAPWQAISSETRKELEHSCGESCTLAMTQRFLATRKLTE
jgi:hypothetical protein